MFAQQVGQWIPAGVAVGIDTNYSPVNSALSGMVDDMAAQMDRVTAPGATQPRATIAAPVSELNTGSGKNESRTANFYLNGRFFAQAIYEDLQAVANDHGYSLILS